MPDDLDREIIGELQRDGRISFEQLGAAVGLSRPAVSARVARLQRTGVIDIVAVVHPEVRGLTASAHLFVEVNADAAAAAAAIAAMPQAPFVTVTAGRHAVMAEVRVAGPAELEAVIGEIRGLPEVARLELLTGVRRLKHPHLPAAQASLPALDEADRRMLAVLERAGRASFAELGQNAGLSPAAARTRTLRMIDAGVLRVPAIVRPQALGLDVLCGFAVQLDSERRAVEEALVADPAVTFLSACLGRADLVGTLATDSLSALRLALDTVRGMPGVVAVESWLHLDVVKERYDADLPGMSLLEPGRPAAAGVQAR